MRPVFRIRAGGADITGVMADRLLALAVTDLDGAEADELTIALDDRDGRIEPPRRGVELSVAMGFAETGLTELGRYVVVGLDGRGPERQLRIRGAAADLTGAIRAPRSGDWTDITLRALVAEIAGRNGLTPRVSDRIASHTYAHVSQTQESDLHLLQRLVQERNAVLKIAGGILAVVPAWTGETASGATLAPVVITASMLSSWSWQLGERTEYGAVLARWGDRPGATLGEERAGTGEPVFEMRRVFATALEARAAAEAKLAALRRGRMGFELAFGGFRAEIGAGQPLDLTGLQRGLNGRWIAARVLHRLDGTGGLRTRVSAEPPAEGGATP